MDKDVTKIIRLVSNFANDLKYF